MLTASPKLFRKLRTFNVVMGIFHLLQALLMFWLSNDSTASIRTFFLDVDLEAVRAGSNEAFGPVINTIFDIQLGPIVASFLLISAIAHFIIASPLYNNKYVEGLKKGVNYARWYEYALSSSIMIVVIAILCGIFDIGALILIFVLNASMNLFGLLMEKMNIYTPRTDWTAFIYGCIAGIAPWIVLAIYFFGALNNVDEAIPTFVYYILGSLFVFFNIFAINMFLQYKKIGPWKSYYFGEIVYIILSLVAKSLLAWQVFGGTLR